MRENQLFSRRKFMILSSAAITSPLLLDMLGPFPEAKAEEKKKSGKIYFINRGCVGCQVCKTFCPQQAIRYGNCGNEIDQEKCIHCGTCYRGCPVSVISETEV